MISEMKYVPPSISETAFNCPHCGALAKQFWFHLYARENSNDRPLPLYIEESEDVRKFLIGNEDSDKGMIEFFQKMIKYTPFFETENGGVYSQISIHNLSIAKCFNCDDLTLWIADKMVFPRGGDAPAPNIDLPEEIRVDYLEASAILDLSPRGAAALVRLCIQKLCKHLGQGGENINTDIKALVAAGLDSRIQKALDAVRVIGNNAVHPGRMDLRDDRATAESLFRLLNLIAEKMISEPKHVDEVYALLPPGARAAIEARDKV